MTILARPPQEEAVAMARSKKLFTEQWQADRFMELCSAEGYDTAAKLHEAISAQTYSEMWAITDRKPLAYNTLLGYYNDPLSIPDDDVVFHAFELALGEGFVAIAKGRADYDSEAERESVWVESVLHQLVNGFLHLDADGQMSLLRIVQRMEAAGDYDEAHKEACRSVMRRADSLRAMYRDTLTDLDASEDVPSLLGEVVRLIGSDEEESTSWLNAERKQAVPSLKEWRRCFSERVVRVEPVTDTPSKDGE